MQFNVGDVVLIRTHLNDYDLGAGHCVYVNTQMLNYIGKQYTVSEVDNYYGERLYRLGSRWWLVGKWLSPVTGRVDRY